ncbi:MAG: stage II sporulation protein R [Oscillospiraceae bacterium]|nr:stage II sporulation protein R [Oscillospiraceae bacterium]
MKKIEAALLMGLIFTALLSFFATNNQCEEIRGSVLRLHILANSDSEEDQSLKLKVRDRLLAETEELFSGAESKEEAIALAEKSVALLTLAAEDEIRKQGYNYGVTVKIAPSYFNTRTYGDVTLPAGEYEAVKVEIGSAKGQNWWCVMFPGMCLPAASGSETKEMSQVLSDEQVNLISGDYKIKFKFIEWYEELVNGK